MALAIRIFARPLQLSHTLWIARHLSLFNTTPRSTRPSHTHPSIPHLLIRHQGPQSPISPPRIVLFIPLLRILLSTIRHLQGTPAVRAVLFIHLRYITPVQAVRFIHHHLIQRSTLRPRTRHRDIVRHIHQSHTLQLIHQSLTRPRARLLLQCILLPRILRFIIRLRTHQ